MHKKLVLWFSQQQQQNKKNFTQEQAKKTIVHYEMGISLLSSYKLPA